MSTTITINSLERFDYEKNTTQQGNPFDFLISKQITGSWNLKRRVFSRTALTKVTDAFSIKVCRVFIPKNIVPVQQSLLFLEIKPDQVPIIDKQIGPRIKSDNPFDGSGISGCAKYSDLTAYGSVWTLVPSNPHETPTHWIYESCTDVAYNQDWRGVDVKVRIRDECGYTLSPPDEPANGITGFTGICDFSVEVPRGPTGCKPLNCDKNGGSAWTAYKNSCPPKQVYLPDPVYFPFFRKENQVMIVLQATYIEFDGVGLEECFA
jgi:hypothetical protein